MLFLSSSRFLYPLTSKLPLKSRQNILAVYTESYKESEDIIRITTNIFVTRETQKMIILGRQGKAIKKVGIESRKDIEEFVGKKVYLELTVKVKKDWRDNDRQLKRFGYEV